MKTVNGPANEIFAFEDVCQILDLESDETDRQTLIEGFISVARDRAETFTRRRLITQDVQFVVSGLRGVIDVPVAPVQSVLKIEFKQSDGTWTELDPAAITLNDTQEPASIELGEAGYPSLAVTGKDNIRVTVRVGYGASHSDVPSGITQSIQLMVSNLYHNRPTPDDRDGCLGVARFLQPFVFWC